MEKEYYPLTSAQKSIWVADNLYPGTSQAVLSATAITYEDLNFNLMNQALNKVVKFNDALRIRLVTKNGIPEQYFAPFQPMDFDILNFSGSNGETEFESWEREMTETPFEMVDVQLFYFAMIQLNERRNICFFKFHHTVVDAWGLVLAVRKIFNEYHKLLNGCPLNSEEPSFICHIEDEIKYIASERYLKHKAFWEAEFDTIPEFTSLTEQKGFRSLKGQRKSFTLSESLSNKLNYFCEFYKVSAFSIFYALLAIYLFKRTHKKDIAIETPILNRSGHTEKNTVGMFMHNIPTRINVEPSSDFLSLVVHASKELKKFMKHQRYPHSEILRDFREKHHFAGTLVDVTLNYHNNKYDSVIPFKGVWHYAGAQSNSLSICISDRDNVGIPTLDYDYLLEVLTEEDIEQMHHHMCTLLENSLENPLKKLSELQMVSQVEIRKRINDFIETKFSYEAKTVSALFEEQVMKTPDHTAIVFGEKSLTYGELNTKANQLAHYLRSIGVTRNSVVGIMVNRSLEMVIGIIGILKAGAAYLPIDPGYPHERIAYMLAHSQAQITLTDKDEIPLTFPENVNFTNISLNHSKAYDYSSENLNEDKASIEDLAYILFTSGSTGKPKGVMVHHKALCNLINGVVQSLNFKNQTIVSLTTLSFDIFFSDTILPLTQGMKVIIANEQEQGIPKYLSNLIFKHRIEVLQATPSRIKLILREEQGRECLKNLSHLLITGEEFPTALLPQLKAVTQAQIFNLYGPTETTVWSTIKNLTHSPKITIGKPIVNTQILILDEYLLPLPDGLVGEIFIAGDGVSLGYLNNPQLTQERFLMNPLVPNEKMYRTGDLGRRLKNGEIEYLGRNDNQVKIRGFRIELGEVETCLLNHSAVKDAVVTVKEDKNGKKHLCAYLTGGHQVSYEELRSHLQNSLPDYMIPISFTWLDAIPLTPNGKIDYRTLPIPSNLDFGQANDSYTAPRSDLEEKLAMLWAGALEVDQIGIDDNLFALGGDSLTILEIMSGALTYNWRLNVQDFYENPTIRQFASNIRLVKGNEAILGKNFVARREMPKEIVVSPVETGNILLTGATGFLGTHLLKELLAQTDKKIYCLVRGNKGIDRLDNVLRFNFPSLPKSMKGRIVVIQGDFSLKHFGMDYLAYRNLAKEVQTVIHCGALVTHYGDYNEFEKVNVFGTCEIIRFCIEFNKKLNYISTMSVSGDLLGNSFMTHSSFDENDFYIGQDYKSNVYIKSKFIAEQEVLKAQIHGLKSTIFRLGVITGRYNDGKFQKNIEQNAFYRRIKSIVSLRIIPESFLDQKIEFSPVDYCAKGIVNIIKMNQTSGLVFHIFNHRMVKGIELLFYLRVLNYTIETLSNEKFAQFVIKLSQTKEGKDILSGIITDLHADRNLNYRSNIRLDSTFTVNYLSKLGFSWPEVDLDYLDKILSYMEEVHFIDHSQSIGI